MHYRSRYPCHEAPEGRGPGLSRRAGSRSSSSRRPQVKAVMRWSKKGLVWNASYDLPWAVNSALTPTPIALGSVIRVYAGFRDELGVSRIGFVDLSAQDPTQVVSSSQKPALDIGRPGAFDDNGVILGHVEAVGETIRMYYVDF